MSDNSGRDGGIGTAGALLVAFVVLKLTGHIQWAWIWVLAPVWMPAGLALGIVLVWLPFWLVAERRQRRHQAEQLARIREWSKR